MSDAYKENQVAQSRIADDESERQTVDYNPVSVWRSRLRSLRAFLPSAGLCGAATAKAFQRKPAPDFDRGGYRSRQELVTSKI